MYFRWRGKHPEGEASGMDAKQLAEIKARLKRGEYYVPYAPDDISALVAEVERLRGVESELAYEKKANETIPVMNRLVNGGVKRIKQQNIEISTLKKALRTACEHIDCWGSTTAETLYSDFIQQAHEQEAST
jgi:hypothetical protein